MPDDNPVLSTDRSGARVFNERFVKFVLILRERHLPRCDSAGAIRTFSVEERENAALKRVGSPVERGSFKTFPDTPFTVTIKRLIGVILGPVPRTLNDIGWIAPQCP